MDGITELETCADELAAAARSLANHCRSADIQPSPSPSPSPTTQLNVPNEAPGGAHRARRAVLTSAARLQVLLSEPADFLQRLASQVGRLSY